MSVRIEEVLVRTPIRLGQFLKVASLVDSGAEATAAINAEVVYVDGELETRRGRQLHGGELVELDDYAAARVVAE